jgi:tetratricopeptide (TPR) repeat protein
MKVPNEEKTLVLARAGNLANLLGDTARAKSNYEAALTLWRVANDRDGISTALHDLGNLAWNEKNFEQARQFFEESLVYRAPNTWGESVTLSNLGTLATMRGDWEQANAYYLRAREICERLGAEAGVSHIDHFLCMLALAQGKLDEAQAHLERRNKASYLQSSPLFRGIGDGLMGYILLMKGQAEQARPLLKAGFQSAANFVHQGTGPWNFVQITEGMARLELTDGRLERAAYFFGISWNARQWDDFPLTEAERPNYNAVIAATRAAMGDENFEMTFEQGKAMTLEDAIAFGLEENSQ